MLVIGMKEHRSVTDPSCTQCHPQAAQEGIEHLVMTTSTCFTCHFRDIPGETSISGCPSCHGPSKAPFSKYTNFNHTFHLNQGYNCITCHINISLGANAVIPKNRCFSCHTSREGVKRYDDFEFIHKNHVTNNKIACYNCHSEVKHSPVVKNNLCAICHSEEHPKDWLYTHKKEVLIGKMCVDCHQPKFCSDCHASGMARKK